MPSDASTDSESCPSCGPTHAVAPGVTLSFGTMPGMSSGLPVGQRHLLDHAARPEVRVAVNVGGSIDLADRHVGAF